MTVELTSASLTGIEAQLITVEVRVCTGLGYLIVGLAGEAVRESLYRVESAIGSCELQMPRQKILICLAPADLRKEGTVFDLPIALGILAASEQIPTDHLAGILAAGELSLSGRLRPVRGVLSMAIEARKAGIKTLLLPKENAEEAAAVGEVKVHGFDDLNEVLGFLNGKVHHETKIKKMADSTPLYVNDLADVKGQSNVKRALEIMAAGGHNGLMMGPPGSGKSMLAARLSGILPPMSLAESMEASQIYSAAGLLDKQGLMAERPFRAPHHTASDIAMIGGGPLAQPGEISLAHHGVLFLDELTEFRRRSLEVLRQPLEDRKVLVSRANYSVLFPANFMLLAAMNPCPCGFYGHPTRPCSCSLSSILAYRAKISGPLLDRIDLHVHVAPANLSGPAGTENSSTVRERVVQAREIQLRRLPEISCNALMNTAMLAQFCPLDPPLQKMLEDALIRYNLSARSYERILKVARTIADLDNSSRIGVAHLTEAIDLRHLDRLILSKSPHARDGR